jgi:hypothetical protein
LAGILAVLLGCTKNVPELATTGPEVVMTPGMRIQITNKTGLITIEYAGRTKRRYGWDGAVRLVELETRRERWYGSMGIYSPGDSTFRDVGGIRRAVLEEGQMHFSSESEAVAWLSQPYNRDILDIVYDDRGLAVGWAKNLARKQINVDVWQILINGKKPTALRGSRTQQLEVGSHEEVK